MEQVLVMSKSERKGIDSRKVDLVLECKGNSERKARTLNEARPWYEQIQKDGEVPTHVAYDPIV